MQAAKPCAGSQDVENGTGVYHETSFSSTYTNGTAGQPNGLNGVNYDDYLLAQFHQMRLQTPVDIAILVKRLKEVATKPKALATACLSKEFMQSVMLEAPLLIQQEGDTVAVSYVSGSNKKNSKIFPSSLKLLPASWRDYSFFCASTSLLSF